MKTLEKEEEATRLKKVRRPKGSPNKPKFNAEAPKKKRGRSRKSAD